MLGSASMLGIDSLKYTHPEKYEMYIHDMTIKSCSYCGRFYAGDALECKDGCGAILSKASVEVPFGMSSKSYIDKNISEVNEHGHFNEYKLELER